MSERFYQIREPIRRSIFEGRVEYRHELGPEGKVELEPEGPRVIAIFTCADKGLPMESRLSVMAVTGKGLKEDRYFKGTGAYSRTKPQKIRDVSIISMEDIEEANVENATNFSPAETRRNIVVTGVKLNGLVGKTIKLGNVSIWVTELCEPCDRPSSLSRKSDFKTVFDNKGGIRGQILNDGEIRIGSRFEVVT